MGLSTGMFGDGLDGGGRAGGDQLGNNERVDRGDKRDDGYGGGLYDSLRQHSMIRMSILAVVTLAAPALAADIQPNGNATLESCVQHSGNAVATLTKALALADGLVKAQADQLVAKDAEIAALQKQLEARVKEPPPPPKPATQ